MKRKSFMAACLALGFVAAVAVAQTGGTKTHQVVPQQNLKWEPGPLPGTQMTVVSGDPKKSGGSFVLRLKLANKIQVPPHWHPMDEHVTVLSGTFSLGMGNKFDAKAVQDLRTGDYVVITKEMRHFGASKGETVLQVHGTGPFAINWVNPADVPAQPAPAKGAPAKKQK